MALFEVRNLTVSFPKASSNERIEVVKNISFNLEKGEVLGIVGESGSGKTMTALSIMRLLPERGEISKSEIIFSGENLLRLPERKMRRIRGKRISMIFQDPASSLNPVDKVGNQLIEMVLNDGYLSFKETILYYIPVLNRKIRKGIENRLIEIMKKMGIADPEKRFHGFQHQFSGGMNQRIMIAMMALITQPEILIADEPTTALDVTVQKRVLDLLVSLVKELDIALILITHNFGLVAEYADQVIVMKEGEIVEEGNVFKVLKSPSHPYTQKLLAVIPKLETPKSPSTDSTSSLQVNSG